MKGIKLMKMSKLLIIVWFFVVCVCVDNHYVVLCWTCWNAEQQHHRTQNNSITTNGFFP